MSTSEIQPELQTTSQHIGEALVSGEPKRRSRWLRLRARLGSIASDISKGCGKSPFSADDTELHSRPAEPIEALLVPLVPEATVAPQPRHEPTWNAYVADNLPYFRSARRS